MLKHINTAYIDGASGSAVHHLDTYSTCKKKRMNIENVLHDALNHIGTILSRGCVLPTLLINTRLRETNSSI